MNNETAVHELYKAFNLLNEKFYENKLPEPYIVILSTVQKKAYGWFTPNKIWTDVEGKIEKHEIAISAEYLNQDFMQVMDTLHHEMIHLYCHTNNIQDTSRKGRYHNKNFKSESEKRGFVYTATEPDKRHGWAFNELSDETKEIIKSFNLNPDALKLARKIRESNSKKKPVYKYECPTCGCKARSSKQLNLTCGDCEEEMIVTMR